MNNLRRLHWIDNMRKLKSQMVVENRDFLPRNAIHRAIHKAAVWCPSVCPSCFCIVSKRETYLHILQQIHTTHERDRQTDTAPWNRSRLCIALCSKMLCNRIWSVLYFVCTLLVSLGLTAAVNIVACSVLSYFSRLSLPHIFYYCLWSYNTRPFAQIICSHIESKL